MFILRDIDKPKRHSGNLPALPTSRLSILRTNTQIKLTILITTLTIVTSTIFTLAFYVTMRNHLRQDARDHTETMARIAALSINGEAHAKLTRPFDRGNPAYIRIKQALMHIRDNYNDVRYVYTLRWTANSRELMVVDKDTAPETIAHLSDKYVKINHQVLVSDFAAIDQTAMATEIYTDDTGQWITGYAPIKSSNGKKEAILGIEISAARLQKEEVGLIKLSLALFLGCVTLAAMTAFYAGRRISAPAQKLLRDIEYAAKGRMTAPLSETAPDEFGRIAATFNQTTAKLKQSVTKLEQEVAIRRTAEQSLAERIRVDALNADIGVALAKSDNLGALLQQCSQTLVKHLGAALARIWTINTTGEYLELQASAGITTETDGFHARIQLHESKIGRIASERRPLLINSVLESPHIYDKEWARKEGLVAFAGHPVIANNEIIGVIALFIRKPLTNIIIQALSTISYQIALGVKQKWAVNKLRDSEEKYRAIVEGIHEGYFEVDLSGNFTFFNDALCQITGYTRDKLTGVKSLQYANSESAKAMYRIFSQVYKSGKSVSVSDFRLISRNGRSIVVELSASLIRDANERKIGFRGIMRDISEKLRSEKERKNLEMQLQHRRKLESIGTLAGGIAHDFNNLLMGIQGNITLIQLKLEPTHPFQNKIKTILELVESGAELTKQLLGFAMGGTYILSPASINDVIRRSLRLFGRTHKNIIIDQQLQKNLNLVNIDRGHIEQVIFNILANASEAMPHGGHLTIQTTKVTLSERMTKPYECNAGPYILIAIRDTGTGMDKKTVQRIFDPFFTTKELGRGTGLGLAAVYGIIKNHKGLVTVDSDEGEGTIFKIYLPVSEKMRPLPQKEKTTGILKGSEGILLIDDEAVIREIGGQMLETLGYHVFIAAGGREGIQLYREKYTEIDLIILDMIMPDLSGGETYDELCKINPNLKVILASGYSEDGQAQTILANGCNGFIQKPYNLKQLSHKIRTVLEPLHSSGAN